MGKENNKGKSKIVFSLVKILIAGQNRTYLEANNRVATYGKKRKENSLSNDIKTYVLSLNTHSKFIN